MVGILVPVSGGIVLPLGPWFCTGSTADDGGSVSMTRNCIDNSEIRTRSRNLVDAPTCHHHCTIHAHVLLTLRLCDVTATQRLSVGGTV